MTKPSDDSSGQGGDLQHALEEAAKAGANDQDAGDIAADDAGGTRLAEAVADNNAAPEGVTIKGRVVAQPRDPNLGSISGTVAGKAKDPNLGSISGTVGGKPKNPNLGSISGTVAGKPKDPKLGSISGSVAGKKPPPTSH